MAPVALSSAVPSVTGTSLAKPAKPSVSRLAAFPAARRERCALLILGAAATSKLPVNHKSASAEALAQLKKSSGSNSRE